MEIKLKELNTLNSSQEEIFGPIILLTPFVHNLRLSIPLIKNTVKLMTDSQFSKLKIKQHYCYPDFFKFCTELQ